MFNKLSIRDRVAFIAFFLGLAIAVIGAFVASQNEVVIILLIIIGLVIGFLSLHVKKFAYFLLATLSLIVIGNVFTPISIVGIGHILGNILAYLATLVAPIAIILTIKTIIEFGMRKGIEFNEKE